VNFRYGRHKRYEIMTPRDIGVTLGDDFFYDMESCSIEPTNLDEAIFLFFIIT